MAKSIGIYVTSDQHLEKIIYICKAAKNKGVETKVFFTHTGTRLCMDDRMKELLNVATVALCKVGFEANELNPDDGYIDKKDYSSQSWHAEMIYDCHRYLTF
jgi:peroxiredoxin family protein